MKVIVCGAGQVGSNIARYLSDEDADVTVIDRSSELVQKITQTQEVQGVVGHASHPDVLERAGAMDAEMIIAVTYADEVNMVACQIAHSLFNVPTKIARIRSQSYLRPIWGDLFSRDNMPIDVIISPEIEVARAISGRLSIPGTFETISFADGRILLIGVICGGDCPIVNTPLRHLTSLFPDLHLSVMAIIRDGRPIIPSADDQMLVGDEVYFVCDADHLRRALSAFGHEEPEARRVVVLGGGNIGLFLAREIETKHPQVQLKVIELDKERAAYVAERLNRAVVLTGDGLDIEVLDEANIAATETFVAVTDDDEGNILASLLAKRQGCARTITLINRTAYTPLVSSLGVDAIVSPRAITVSTILQHIRRGRIQAVHTLRDGFAEIIEAEALETSGLVNTPLSELRLPGGILVGAILRGNQVLMPRPNAVIRPHDRVVILATHGQVRKVEKMFAVRLEFF